MKAKNKKRFKRDVFTIITTLIGMIFIAGCTFVPVSGTVMEKEYSPSGSKYNWSKNKWETKSECYELDIVDAYNKEHELCVSEQVFDDAMLGHYINITKEYH